ncbi:MAG TPA: ATP-binding protein [Opitutaceae bacterium]|nr:ATP-binding protein [Opitutaceae bacterium]
MHASNQRTDASAPGDLPLAGASPLAAPVVPTGAERLRLLESAVVNSYDSIIITDAGAPGTFRPRIVFANHAFTRLFGYTLEEAFGQPPAILQGPASDPAEIARIRDCLMNGELFTGELINYRKDGTPLHVEVRIMPIRNAHGELANWIGVQRDITARKNAAAEREKLELRLREKQKLESLGVLAGGVAHDFNNLLTVILGNASLARLDSRSPEAVEQNLRLIESAAVRAADLCRQMLAYSGKGRYVVRPIAVDPVIRETITLVRSSSGRGRTLELKLAGDLPAVVADATQLQQVAMNVLLNAIEATEPGTGVVRVATRVEHVDSARLAHAQIAGDLPGGDYVVLEVADNGCGISPEIHNRIFDPFFTTKFTGRGLGLAAVQGIVRAHRGVIEFESTPGRGSTFRILLPASADPVTTGGPQPMLAPYSGKGRTVLVVDDEDVLRETVRELVQRLGYTVLAAGDGLTAVEIYRQRHAEIDAILLDLSMPHFDGAATFDAMHAIDPSPQVILMSGFSEEEAIQRFQGRGVAAFLQKPFPIQTLLATLASVLSAG